MGLERLVVTVDMQSGWRIELVDSAFPIPCTHAGRACGPSQVLVVLLSSARHYNSLAFSASAANAASVSPD